jgi:hypothetical protein
MVGPIVYGLIQFTCATAAGTGLPAQFDLMRAKTREIIDIIPAQPVRHGDHLVALADAHTIIVRRVLPVVDILAGQEPRTRICAMAIPIHAYLAGWLA